MWGRKKNLYLHFSIIQTVLVEVLNFAMNFLLNFCNKKRKNKKNLIQLKENRCWNYNCFFKEKLDWKVIERMEVFLFDSLVEFVDVVKPDTSEYFQTFIQGAASLVFF